MEANTHGDQLGESDTAVVDLIDSPPANEAEKARSDSSRLPQDETQVSEMASCSLPEELFKDKRLVCETEKLAEETNCDYDIDGKTITSSDNAVFEADESESAAVISSGAEGVESTAVPNTSENVVLSDGITLRGETDVDAFTSIELTGRGETLSILHNVTDLSSMSASISTDKNTVTSSPMSTSSLDEDSVGIVDSLDSMQSTSVMFHNKPRTPVTEDPEANVSGNVANKDLCEDEEKPSSHVSLKEEKEKCVDNDIGHITNESQMPQASEEVDSAISHKADNGQTQQSTREVDSDMNHTADDSYTPQTTEEVSLPSNSARVATESCGVDSHGSENHPQSSDTQNGSAVSEPFTSFVDDLRLRADLASLGELSGNVKEQELRSLVQNRDSQSRKQLKKLLRSGSWTPVSTVRKVAWLLLCKYLHKLEKAYVYLQMEKELYGDCEEEDVPVLVWPQQPAHEEHVLTEYYLTPRGKNTAHKIMAIIGQLSPDITYCPGLLPLVDLFLHYMDAPDCFSCVLTLLQSKGPVYLMQSRVAFEASKRVMKDLAKKYVKSAYVSLVRSCSNLESVFDNWMGWIYSDLPFNHVVAVTDCYLMEGIKVLYRVVLAILTLFTKHSCQMVRGSTGIDIAHNISEFCQNLPVPPKRLLKVAFKIRGFSRRKIIKLQNHHEGIIASGSVSVRPDMPRVASSQSIGDLSMPVSTAVSMAHPNTKMMGFHDTGSNVLTVDQFVTLWSWLPPRHAIYQPQMLFNSADQGSSLMTLYAHIEMNPCTIIIIKTVEGEVFGAFCADPWVERRTHCRPIRFFGTGETFLFTLLPERVKFEWVGKPDPHVPLSANMFQAGDNSSLLIGGGSGSGIQLDGMMERCRTETCDTFNNPPLCPSKDFVPAAVEVFGLQ